MNKRYTHMNTSIHIDMETCNICLSVCFSLSLSLSLSIYIYIYIYIYYIGGYVCEHLRVCVCMRAYF